MNLARFPFLLIALTIGFALLAYPIGVRAEEHGKSSEGEHKKPEKKHGGEGGEGKKPSSDTTMSGDNVFVRMAPLVLPIINDKGVQQILTIVLTLQVKDFDAADDIHSNMPRVQDGILQALYGGLGEGTLRQGNMLNLPKVKSKIIRSLNKVLGPDKITDVLIEGVAQRMLQHY